MQQGAAVTPMLADAFANAVWVALGLIAIAVVPALLLPSGRVHERSADAAAKEVSA